MKTDALLWYNVGDWSKYGLAVINVGDDRYSQNSTIVNLNNLIGRHLQSIMATPDAKLASPPSINRIVQAMRMVERIRSVLSSRAVAPGTQLMETTHALPAPEEFRVYPVPYFKCRQPWMKEMCGLTLLALTDMVQHTENARPLEITTTFAGQIGQYFQRIYIRTGVELLQLPASNFDKPDYTIPLEAYRSYNPANWASSTELIDTVPSLIDWPTEDDLQVLTDGIPVSQLPELKPWPNGLNLNGTASSGGTATVSSNPAFVTAPGTI